MERELLVILAVLLPGLPLIGFAINALFGSKLPKAAAGWLSSVMVFGSFIISVVFFCSLSHEEMTVVKIFDWFNVGPWNIDFAFLVDPLSMLMLLIVTGVGFLIHVYSIGYMHDDEDMARFFAYLNLFIFFMLILVLGNSYLIMFIGWEGVGACSYLLIGFWYKNQSYNLAAKKAFVMNRIGDVGFVLAMFFLLSTFGTLEFVNVNLVASGYTDKGLMTVITLLLFFAATGKSAQIPLFTWLPDAMAGPTPVSALIHAATMVTAGIYMIARSSVLFLSAPITMEIILYIGTATCLMAALIGLKQNDIKKVLAYSTVSQLGLLFAAIGVGAFSSAFFHLMTHAFFKALLFLGAGSVIHALHGEQDIRNMGGLRKYIKVTYFTFLLATLAISGIPPFSGFFSKDEILAHVFAHSPAFWVILQASSLITVFYMFRLVYLVFFNEFRGTEHTRKHIHESPAVITVPLIILAVLATFGGFIGMPAVTGLPHMLHEFISPSLTSPLTEEVHIEHSTELILMLIAVAGAVVVILIARNYYVTRKTLPEPEGQKLPFLPSLVANKFYVDEIYRFGIKAPVYWLGEKIYTVLDKGLFDRIVNGSGTLSNIAGEALRRTQHGSTGVYIFAMVAGIIALMIIQIVLR